MLVYKSIKFFFPLEKYFHTLGPLIRMPGDKGKLVQKYKLDKAN